MKQRQGGTSGYESEQVRLGASMEWRRAVQDNKTEGRTGARLSGGSPAGDVGSPRGL